MKSLRLYIILATVCTALNVGCKKNAAEVTPPPTDPYAHYTLTVTPEVQLPQTLMYEKFTVLHFDSSMLKKVEENVEITDRKITLDLDGSNQGVVYIINKQTSELSGLELIVDTTTIQQINELEFTHSYENLDYTPQQIISQKLSVAQTAINPQSITPDLSTATINTLVLEQMQVHKISLRGTILTTYLPFGDVPNSTTTEKTLTHTFSTPATEGLYSDIFRLFAHQHTESMDVELIVTLPNGTKSTMYTSLPMQIIGGQTYTILIDSHGASLSVDLNTEEWDEGQTDTNMDALESVVVDKSATTLPSGVTLSEFGDKIYAQYTGASFNLSLTNHPLVTSIKTSGDITLTENSSNQYSLTVHKAEPNGLKPSISVIYVTRTVGNTQYTDQIEIHRETNPILITGAITQYYNQGNFVATDYLDAEIASITLPVGYTIEVPETNWTQHTTTTSGQTIITAGFRPNDTNANGQNEECTVKITSPKGEVDSYTLSRQRLSLPVIWFNGRYWTKFNMRGNPESYTDQIQLNDRLNQIEDLYTYLKDCPADDVIEITGGVYVKSSNTPLVYTKREDSDRYQYSGYLDVFSTDHIAEQEAGHSCPNGFSRPTSEELKTIIYDQATFGGSLTFEAIAGEITHSTITTQVGSYKVNITAYRNNRFEYQGGIGSHQTLKLTSTGFTDQFIIPGLGTQNSTTDGGHLPNYCLYGIYAPGTTNIFNLNYNQSNQLRVTHQAQYVRNTYQIRCIKNNDAFIIED